MAMGVGSIVGAAVSGIISVGVIEGVDVGGTTMTGTFVAEGLGATTTAGTVGVGGTLLCGVDNIEYSPASTSIVPTAMLTSAPTPMTVACLLAASVPADVERTWRVHSGQTLVRLSA